MSIQTYYLSKRNVSGVGGLFLCNQLQLAESTGGGKALLGSVVTENKDLFHTDYPVPLTVFSPQVLLTELRNKKNELGIGGDITVRQDIAAGHETFKIEKKNSFSTGLGPFPAIPVNGKFQIDYSRMSSIDITYGEGTYYEYIPQGYMGMLYESLKGEPTTQIGGKFLKKNSYISLIWIASKWTVSFKSTKEFSTGVEAQLSAYNLDKAVEGKVKLEQKNETTIDATIDGTVPYLVGLMSTRWTNLKMT